MARLMRRPRPNISSQESSIRMKCPNLRPPLYCFIDWDHLEWMWPWHLHWGRSAGAATRSWPPTVSCKHILLKGSVPPESGSQCIRAKAGLELGCPCSFPIVIYYKVLKIRNWNWIKVRYSTQRVTKPGSSGQVSQHMFLVHDVSSDLKVNNNVCFFYY